MDNIVMTLIILRTITKTIFFGYDKMYFVTVFMRHVLKSVHLKLQYCFQKSFGFLALLLIIISRINFVGQSTNQSFTVL